MKKKKANECPVLLYNISLVNKHGPLSGISKLR